MLQEGKRYVFDLDNTLCDTKKKGDGNWDYLNANPFAERIILVNKLYDEGNYIIIETARGSVSKKNWYEETYNQLVSYGLKFHELRTGVKFNGDVFIDDKGINSEVFFDEKKYQLKKTNLLQTKIELFNEIFVEKNLDRLNEYVFCINKNIENPSIEKIYLVCNKDLYETNIEYFEDLFQNKIKENTKINLILEENKRFTFNNFIYYTKKILQKGTIAVVSNLDIFIPNTENWKNLEKDFFQYTENDYCLALSRTEYINDSYSFRDERAWKSGEFADCWVFKTPIKISENDFPFEIPVGSAPTCDNHMFLIMGNTHEKVFNWAEKYIIYHLDLVRKPDVLEKKSGRMIMNDDVVKLKENYFDKIPPEKWRITPYQNWDRIIKQIKYEKMQKGALEDKFAFQELEKLINQFNIKRIIETGTYYGWSTKKMSELGLRIDTIEINEKFYKETKKTLTQENVKMHLGNSVNVLKEIIEDGEENLLIFIDSHWGELPLLQELEVIKNKKIEPVILIHDFYVPDENGKAKFGYDTYGNITLNFEFIEKSLNEIYPNGFDFYYTKEIEFCNSGTIYITPKTT
jgi:hypothetical protein